MFLQLLLAYQVMSLNSESGNVTNSGDIINHQETHISDEKQELWYIIRVEYSPLIFVETAKCLAEIAFLYYQYYWNLVEKICNRIIVRAWLSSTKLFTPCLHRSLFIFNAVNSCSIYILSLGINCDLFNHKSYLLAVIWI